jgi:hypothetical protein
MITILYDPHNGDAVADGRVVQYVDDLAQAFKHPDFRLTVGCASLIDEIRVRVVRKEIEHTNVQFLFANNGKLFILTCNEFGKLSEWPMGFCDLTINQLREIGMSRRSEHKE